ncbi:hypothetical protein [Caballeronia sp. LZ001]|nr:hypothetical protein [Caballeronia sp. LZ001]MDR5803037.1 hypothetical protein [Caballeronia sp. LZ001]
MRRWIIVRDAARRTTHDARRTTHGARRPIGFGVTQSQIADSRQ